GGRATLRINVAATPDPFFPHSSMPFPTEWDTATTAGPILALDLGKYKSVACAYPGDPADARFESLTTDRQHLRKLFARHRPAVVVIQACAPGRLGPRPMRRMPALSAATAGSALALRATRTATKDRLHPWPSLTVSTARRSADSGCTLSAGPPPP